MTTEDYIRIYARYRPLFLSVLRGKEAALYQRFLPFRHPVLDVGCGDGFFAGVAFGKQRIDIGLDMEDSRIGEAEQSHAYKTLERFDGVSMPFRARSFRTVVTNSVLEHVSDLDRLVPEMYRVLASGGTCYATVMAAPWEEYLFGAKIFGNAYRRWMRNKQVHVNLLTHGEWRAAFRNAGFRVTSVIPYGSPRASMWLDILHYLSIPGLIGYMINRRWVWWPNLTRMYPVKFFARLMDEAVDAERASVLMFVLTRP